MEKRRSEGTPAIRALDAAGIDYALQAYALLEDGDTYGESVATALSVDPARLFKTLLAEVDARPVVAIVPVSTPVGQGPRTGRRREEGGASLTDPRGAPDGIRHGGDQPVRPEEAPPRLRGCQYGLVRHRLRERWLPRASDGAEASGPPAGPGRAFPPARVPMRSSGSALLLSA